MKTGLIEEIKERISCVEYMAREHGAQLSGGRCRSFRPDAKNPSSLLVRERDWYDFGSGQGGDVIDMAAHDRFAGDKGAAIRYLAERWGIAGEYTGPKLEVVFRTYLAVLDKATEFYQSCLHPEQIAYLHGRGLTDETIRDLRLGWAENPCRFLEEAGFTMEEIADAGVLNFVNRLMIPYLRNGRTAYLIGRASVWEDKPSSTPEAKYVKLYRGKCSEHPIWGFDTLARPGTVIVAEGIFDAISCYQEDYPVVTAVTGAFSAEQKKDLFPALQGRDVIVCMDYDPVTKAGQKFTAALADELFEAGIHVQTVFLSGGDAKEDLSSLYALNPCKASLQAVFADARDWASVKIERIAAMEQEQEKRAALAAFLRRCALTCDWPTTAQLVKEAEETDGFAKVWLRELAKTLNKAPQELSIVREFKKKYDCVFHDALGWHEYDKSLWKRRSEYEVRQKIAELFGRFRTARNVESVHRLLQAELLRRELFDREKELLNFRNGMFDLEKGELLPHSREYFSTIQLPFEYHKDAECPLFDEFLEDVTAGDLTRHNLLQEMFGYCLTKDVRYQKAFCLVGDGANGKSVLLSVLEALIGEENSSHVEIAFLGSDFQRIKLLHSQVNICSDMKTDVAGTESFFKAVVAGDPISGCYKGEDFVDFRPYCKMVFSVNRMLSAREVDYSYLRRLCFVEFPVKFTEEPLGRMEKKVDRGILAKLLTELPGIFNWALTGLRALREKGRFTETEDQRRMTRELLAQSNPLIGFVEDVIQPGGPYWHTRLSKQEVYGHYNRWCRETNTMPLSTRSFWPRLRALQPYREVRTSDGRYVELDFSDKSE